MPREPRTCQHCGDTYQPPGRGRLPLYCSTRCRRDHCTREGTCADCGKTMVIPNGDPVPDRCGTCSPIHLSRRFAAREKRAALIELYEQGVPLKEMADRLGYSSASTVNVAINRLRRRYGIDLPYRYAVDENGRRTAA